MIFDNTTNLNTTSNTYGTIARCSCDGEVWSIVSCDHTGQWRPNMCSCTGYKMFLYGRQTLQNQERFAVIKKKLMPL